MMWSGRKSAWFKGVLPVLEAAGNNLLPEEKAHVKSAELLARFIAAVDLPLINGTTYCLLHLSCHLR